MLVGRPPLTLGFFLSRVLPNRQLHYNLSLLQNGRGGGGGRGGGQEWGGGFSKLLRIFMQQESSALSITPKRTARKGVKAGVNKSSSGVRSVSTLSSVERQQQQQNDPSREDPVLRADWQRFCKTEVPMLVRSQMGTIKELEMVLAVELVFGGPRGSLKGRPGAVEDHRHRAFYQTLSDSEEKLLNFAARQVACRILGSTGYSCENCWFPPVDCRCEAFERGTLYGGVCLWLYMHLKDSLRKNNTFRKATVASIWGYCCTVNSLWYPGAQRGNARSLQTSWSALKLLV